MFPLNKNGKTWLFLAVFPAVAKSEEWAAQFKPYERQAAPDLTPTINSINWYMVVFIIMLTMILLYMSLFKLKAKGDLLGSMLSAIGAFIVASSFYWAREVAK